MSRLFLFGNLICLLLLCSCASNNNTVSEDRPPNVVIFFIDDQGYQDLGCYGSPDITTPNIDELARQGARFTDFYVAQPVCSASRAALMTGCYPSRVDVMGAYGPRSRRGLNPDETTIAEMLRSVGYATACYGKWHLGHQPEFLPLAQGFDEYFGIPFSNDMWRYHPENDIHGFTDLPLIEDNRIIDTLEDQTDLTVQFTERAVDFIDRHADQPFFLYVPHPQPHVPLFVSDRYKESSPRGLYGDVISEIDWSVGQVVEALEKHGLTENTIVIYASDNGPWLSYGDHSGSALPLREGKGTTWEGGVRVPGIIKYPKLIPAGRVISRPAMTIDLLPTLAEISGAPLPDKKIDGRSILPLLTDSTDTAQLQRAYFFYYRQNELHSMRQGPWKLYFPHRYRTLNGSPGGRDGIPVKYEYRHSGLELYNLEQDISERKDVAEEYPEVVARMQALAEECRSELGDALTGVEGTEVRPAGISEVEE